MRDSDRDIDGSLSDGVDEYDGLLAAIPVSMAGGALAGWLAAVPLTAGVLAGSLLAGLLTFVSLFVVPPTG